LGFGWLFYQQFNLCTVPRYLVQMRLPPKLLIMNGKCDYFCCAKQAGKKLFMDKNKDVHSFIYRGCVEVHNAQLYIY